MKVVSEAQPASVDAAPAKGAETSAEGAESAKQVKPDQAISSTHLGEPITERVQLLESELGTKRKECEVLEHEVRKRQKRCLDLESQLVEERSRNELLAEEAELLRRKALLLDQSRAEHEELKEELCELSAQHRSVLEENQRLRAKLENLEQVLKHMREVTERRQQLELEHDQALAILKFKQDELKRLQQAQLFAKREHESVVQMLEDLVEFVLHRELVEYCVITSCLVSCTSSLSLTESLSRDLQRALSVYECICLIQSSPSSFALPVLGRKLCVAVEPETELRAKVRDLEDKCRSQSQQFGMLSQELDKFRLQASKADVSEAGLLSGASLTQLTNGVILPGQADLTALLRAASTPHAAELSRSERSSPLIKHRELPSITSVKTSSSSSSRSPHSQSRSLTHLSPRSAQSPRKSSPTHEVDTASEVEELDIDVPPVSFSVRKAAAKLQVFIARYSYNPYDGPNENPEVELPLTAGEYIYVYGDMDDDGFYEGELMDGRRGLVPSNFIELISDEDFMSSHAHQPSETSHNSFQESSFHSNSERLHQHHVRFGQSVASETVTSPKTNPNLTAGVPLTNGLDLDLEEPGVDSVPFPRKLALIKQLAKSVIVSWEAPLVPAGWGSVFSYNVYVDQELRLSVPFGAQTKAVLERLELTQRAYRVSVQCLTDHGNSDQLRCSMLVGRDVCVAPTHLRVDKVTSSSASLTWMPSNSNYVHIVSLNEEECELVKAGCYWLSLSHLTPSMHYSVKVEARPPRTAWELSPECRDKKSTITAFTTLAAGPPDAPLDVQLEQGPSPGIAQISWLPVTIDATGTSNGVPVTGYSIYVDKRKVLEVSSPTAGSALIGPSQIQTLQAARELTVRTMSASGESVDSLPVNIPAKLPAIMSGASLPQCQSVPATSANLEPAACATSLSAAKTTFLPQDAPLDEHSTGSVQETNVNSPKAVVQEMPPSSVSYVEAWASHTANALSMGTMAAQEAPPARASHTDPMVSVSRPMVSPAPVARPPAAPTPSMPAHVPLATPGAISAPVAVAVPAPSTIPMPTPPVSPVVVPVSMPLQSAGKHSRDTHSPGAQRPVASLSDFLENACDKLQTPPPTSTSPQMNAPPGKDPLEAPSPHPLRPPAQSPFESETEEDRENTRLVSIEEFLRPTPVPQIKSSRSDLSDILEEEEEDLYSEPIGDVSSRGYSMAPTGRSTMWETDSDEEVLEKIIKLPPQAYRNKQLFSIPEVTDEEDNTESEHHPRASRVRASSGRLQQSGHFPYHHSRGPKTEPEKSLVRYKETAPVKSRPRVHYADTVDTINYPKAEELDLASGSSMYARPSSGSLVLRRTTQKALGDRLRREALLRSQMSLEPHGMVASPGTSQGSYLVSKTVHRVKSPTGPSTEIDVEYGTDNDEEPQLFDPGEVVLEQMSSEWWVEGGSNEYHQLPPIGRSQPELPSSCRSW
ncbi:hypothetical protein DNTS_003308, partial [Danionella cerebrum]